MGRKYQRYAETLFDIILILAYSIYGGDKITEKWLDKLDSNLCSREINIKFLEQKFENKLNKPQEVTKTYIEERKGQLWSKRSVEKRFSGQEKKTFPSTIKKKTENNSCRVIEDRTGKTRNKHTDDRMQKK